MDREDINIFNTHNNHVGAMSSSEEKIKKHNRNSKEITQANSRPSLSSRVINSTNFTNS